nr:MAG TPA: hypothetical protein [Caudoviricetes sp.]
MNYRAFFLYLPPVNIFNTLQIYRLFSIWANY